MFDQKKKKNVQLTCGNDRPIWSLDTCSAERALVVTLKNKHNSICALCAHSTYTYEEHEFGRFER